MSGERYAERLASLIEATSGHVVPPDHFPFLADAAERRAHVNGMPGLEAYVRALAAGSLPQEWRSLLPLVTVKESYLFRTPQHFRAITDTLLPALLRARAASRRLRCWSAGCARGEEPATLAVVLAEEPGLAGWDWRILASDVDEEALAVARTGRFGDRAVAHVPPALRRRYFRPQGEEFELVAPLRGRIDYVAANLVEQPLRVPGGPFDLVLLRNVLIYFSPETQRRVVASVSSQMAPDAALFLAPAETLWQLRTPLVPVQAGGCFYYGRCPVPKPSAGAERSRGAPRPQAGHPLKAVVSSPPPSTSGFQPPTEPGPSARERLVEAARRVADGDLEAAAAQAEELLVSDPGDALAHTLEGFVHDVSGRSQMAAASYRAALFLRPELTPVRFLLAEALRRLGWEGRAHQEYRRVLASIPQRLPPYLEPLAALPLPEPDWMARVARDRLLQLS